MGSILKEILVIGGTGAQGIPVVKGAKTFELPRVHEY
jgi:hypothetical protein